MSAAIKYHLDRVNWDFFLSLSFKGGWAAPSSFRQNDITEKDRHTALCAWYTYLRFIESKLSREPRSLYWALRIERGELGKRVHLHALLMLPNRRATRALSFFLKNAWEQCHRKHGNARTRICGTDTTETAADYLLKSGANEYESGKFGSDVYLCSLLSEPGSRQALAV